VGAAQINRALLYGRAKPHPDNRRRSRCQKQSRVL